MKPERTEEEIRELHEEFKKLKQKFETDIGLTDEELRRFDIVAKILLVEGRQYINHSPLDWQDIVMQVGLYPTEIGGKIKCLSCSEPATPGLKGALVCKNPDCPDAELPMAGIITNH